MSSSPIARDETKRVINHLRELGMYKRWPEDTMCGLCAELAHITQWEFTPSAAVYISAAKSWKNYSGSLTHPLLGGESAYYSVIWHKWARWNKYGRDRRAFCLHMANALEKVL